VSTSTSSSPAEATKLLVGVGDLKLSTDHCAEIVTFALGSCVGVTVYDPSKCVGGLLHAMLPQSKLACQENAKPEMFVDTGVPELFRRCYELGAEKHNLIVCVAGGACRLADHDGDLFKIGQRNVEMARALMEINCVNVQAWDVGGTHARTLVLSLPSGRVYTRSGVEEKSLT